MEFWAMAAVSAGTAIVGGAMQSRSARKQQKEQNKHDVEMARVSGEEDRRTLEYQRRLGDYQKQLDTQRRRDARGAVFDKYSGIAKPTGYTRAPLVSGEAPAPPPPTSQQPVQAAPTTGAANPPGLIDPRRP